MKTPKLILTGILASVLLGCSTLSTSQQAEISAVTGNVESIVNAVAPAAATVYGGADAGAAAQNALYSLENQLNPLVGKTVPVSVVQNSTGTAQLDNALVAAGVVSKTKPLTVADIQKIDTAAELAPLIVTAMQTPNTAQRKIMMRRIDAIAQCRLRQRNVSVAYFAH